MDLKKTYMEPLNWAADGAIQLGCWWSQFYRVADEAIKLSELWSYKSERLVEHHIWVARKSGPIEHSDWVTVVVTRASSWWSY